MIDPSSAADEGLGLVMTSPGEGTGVTLFDFQSAYRALQKLSDSQVKDRHAIARIIYEACVGEIFMINGASSEDEEGKYQYSEIHKVFAEHGYGPLMYYAAGHFSAKTGGDGYIGSNTTEVNAEALNIWKHFYNGPFKRRKRALAPLSNKKDPEVKFVYKVDGVMKGIPKLLNEGRFGVGELAEQIGEIVGAKINVESVKRVIVAQSQAKWRNHTPS